MRLVRNGLIILLFVCVIAEAQNARVSTGITGRVTDAEGNPIPGVTIQVTSSALLGERTVVTGDSGGYRFAGLPPGKYTVTASLGSDSVTQTASLSVGGSASADFVLPIITPTTGTVAGNVKDKDGKPLKANISIVDKRGNSSNTSCNAEGNYSKSGVRAGSQRVTASLDGYGSSSKDVTVPVNGTAQADFVLTKNE